MMLKEFPISKADTKILHSKMDALIDQALRSDSEASTLHVSVPYPKEKKQLYFTIAVSLSPYMPRLDGE